MTLAPPKTALPETTPPAKGLRLFFALWPRDSERAVLTAWQPALHKLCGGKPTPAHNLHATLIFMGSVPEHRLEALKLAAQEIQGRKFVLTFDLAHYWGHNHIVHAAPAITPAPLAQLVHDLGQGLPRHHFPFDQRPDYKPHITLLRHAKCPDAPLPDMPQARWSVDHFVLAQSVSSAGGVLYQVLEEFPLQ